MNRIKREELIERYLGGEMTPAEEEGFLIDVASDPELRHDLKASQVIDSAIRKDRATGTLPTGKMRAELAALLVPAHQLVQSPDQPVSSVSSGFFSSWGAGVLTGVLSLVVLYGVVADNPPIVGNEPAHQTESVEPSVTPAENLMVTPDQPVDVLDNAVESSATPVTRTFRQPQKSVGIIIHSESTIPAPVALPERVVAPALASEVPEFDYSVTNAPTAKNDNEPLTHTEENNMGELNVELDNSENQE